jgi:SAM-dependent methyltransferase
LIDERDGHRRALVDGLHGRVVEIGAGTGLCFAGYPSTVSGVVAVEPDRASAAAARRAALRAPVKIEVADGVAERLPLADGSADAAVTSLVLCSVRDPAGALGELRRVLRPGGELRFYEHVGGGRVLLRAASPAYRVFGGCHLARDTEAAIRAAGFAIDRIERFAFRERRWEPAIPHILGRAYPA